MHLTDFSRSLLSATFFGGSDPRPEWGFIEDLIGGPWSPHLALFSSEIIEGTVDDMWAIQGGDEADGGGYDRQPMILSLDDVDYEATNSDPCTFASMPEGTWTHAALMASATALQPILIGELTTPKNTFSGQTLTLQPGDVAFRMTGNLTPDFFGWINQFINWVEWPDLYGHPTLHLYTADGEVGTAQTMQMTMPGSVDGVFWNLNTVTFPSVDTEGLDIIEARLRSYDADYVGDMFAGPLVAPQPDPAGGSVVFAPGDFELTFQ